MKTTKVNQWHVTFYPETLKFDVKGDWLTSSGYVVKKDSPLGLIESRWEWFPEGMTNKELTRIQNFLRKQVNP